MRLTTVAPSHGPRPADRSAARSVEQSRQRALLVRRQRAAFAAAVAATGAASAAKRSAAVASDCIQCAADTAQHRARLRMHQSREAALERLDRKPHRYLMETQYGYVDSNQAAQTFCGLEFDRRVLIEQAVLYDIRRRRRLRRQQQQHHIFSNNTLKQTFFCALVARPAPTPTHQKQKGTRGSGGSQ
jgi:hypothetical protein